MAKAKKTAAKKKVTASKTRTAGKAPVKKTPAKGAAKKKTAPAAVEVPVERREASRRSDDRRQEAREAPVERRTLERRTKVSRRRQIDPTTCERDYSIEEIEFMRALDDYKRRSGRMFPTCSEILEVVRELGYCKPGEPQPEEQGMVIPQVAEAATDVEIGQPSV